MFNLCLLFIFSVFVQEPFVYGLREEVETGLVSTTHMFYFPDSIWVCKIFIYFFQSLYYEYILTCRCLWYIFVAVSH
jgi:hypothetical protein